MPKIEAEHSIEKLLRKGVPEGSRITGRRQLGTPLEKTLYLPSGLYVVHVLPGGPALKALALRLRTEARGRIYVASGEFRPRELKDFVKQ